MVAIKLGKSTYKIKFSYEATVRSGILKKFARLVNRDQESNLDAFSDSMEILPELLLVGLQKYHRDKFGYSYSSDEEREEALAKVYAILDEYFDDENASFEGLSKVLEKELTEDGFLSKMLRKEAKEQEEAEN